jgi:hypothetical protein
MKKEKKTKLTKEQKYDNAWNDGFYDGIQIGMFEAIGILMFQAEQHGNVAGINDLIKLIKKEMTTIAESYK